MTAHARVRFAWLVVAGVALTASCGSDDAPSSGRIVESPPPPEGAVELISPEFTVPAGEERFVCMQVPFDVTEDLFVNWTVAYQADGGHHSMLFFAPEDATLDPNPHECTESDMTNVRFLGVGTGFGVGIHLPEGIAMKIPRGARIFTQSHYVNATGSDARVQDVLHLGLLEQPQVTSIAGAFTQIDLTFELPPRVSTTRTVDCEIARAMNVPWMVPHMHEYGQHYRIELTRGAETTMLYDNAWDEALRDHFPVVDFDGMGIALQPGDRLKTTCTWDNTTDEPMIFPREMCATFLMFYPSEGEFLTCDETGVTSEL